MLHASSVPAMVTRALCALVLPGAGLAADPIHAQDAPVRVDTYELDVTFRPESAALEAAAHITFEPPRKAPDSLTFYLHGELSVDSIVWSGGSVPFAQEKVYYYFDYSLIANRVAIPLSDRSLTSAISVFYRGYFSPSRVRSLSDYTRIDADGVLLRSYGYSLWFPIFLESRQTSYKVSFPSVTIRTPSEFRTVFVGSLVGEREDGTQRVSRWQASDIDLLDVQCSARRWEVTARENTFAYHNPNDASRFASTHLLAFSKQLVSLYRQNYRAQATAPDVYYMEMPRYGAISSSNVVGVPTISWHRLDREGAVDLTVAHELVHPFVRFEMDFSDPLWAFMIEGFPSYFYQPALAEIDGEEGYRTGMRGLEQNYLRDRDDARAGRRGIPPEKPLLEITAAEMSLYKDRFVLGDRGSLFFNYLRTRMGSEGFFAFTRDLFSTDSLDVERLVNVILKHLPDAAEDVRTWLMTSDYPEHFRLENLWSSGPPGYSRP